MGEKPEIARGEGLIYGTIVTHMEWEGKGPDRATIQGNRLTIEGMGSVYFGEIIIEKNFRRLTLARFQLGSPYGGSMSACEVQSNGSWWPPQDVGN
jgi:hypothetical protein